MPFRWGSKTQKNGKLKQNLHGIIFERKSIGSKQRQKKSSKRRANDVKNQDAREGPRQGPTQGFNLLQMSPNWLLGIWTLDPI